MKPLPRSEHWASPTLLAEISFTEMTSDGKLRHPSFKGLRDDKPATTVIPELPVVMKEQGAGRPKRSGH